MSRIYLDHAATTPMHPLVVEAMKPWIASGFGNPSSLHTEGRAAKDAIDQSREILSDRLGSLFAEVLFTSSGTEAANLALIGTALEHQGGKRKRILIGAAEHHCVLHTQNTLQALGYTVELIPVDCFARVSMEALAEMISDDVLLVSVMHANNELGTFNPIREIADHVHSKGALLHSDVVQTFLNSPTDWKVADLDADILTMSAHKVNGPKGAGAIYLRAGVKLKPLIVGGGQEREMRGGTENVAAITGFGEAVRVHNQGNRREARDTFENRLIAAGFVPTVYGEIDRLDGHCHVRYPGIDAETMLIRLDREGISASSGAACSSGSIEPSHVLLACGYSADEAKEGLRFTFASMSISDAQAAADRVIAVRDAVLGQR